MQQQQQHQEWQHQRQHGQQLEEGFMNRVGSVTNAVEPLCRAAHWGDGLGVVRPLWRGCFMSCLSAPCDSAVDTNALTAEGRVVTVVFVAV